MLIYVSEYNPVKFYEYFKEYQGGFRFFDDYTVKDATLDYQDEAKWEQNWQTNDTIIIQIQSDSHELSFDLLDCYGEVVKTAALVVKTTNWHEPDMYVLEGAMPLNVDEGRYFLSVNSVGGIILISDPINVADYHENSLLLTYNHRRNKGDLAFDTNITFTLRLQSILREFSPGIDATVYIDQNRNTTVLSSTPYRIFKMIIGDGLGVPDFIADKVNRIFGLSSVFIDKKQMARVEGANMQSSHDPYWPLKGWTLDITEAINRDAMIFGDEIVTTSSFLLLEDGGKIILEAGDGAVLT